MSVLLGLGACDGAASDQGLPASGGTQVMAGGAASGGFFTGTGGAGTGGASVGGSPSPSGGSPVAVGAANSGGISASGSQNSGGSDSGGDSGTGGRGGSGACTRELLREALRDYLTALALHDPSALPRSETLKFTENGEALEIGAAGLWTTAGLTKYSQMALDTEACTALAQAVIPDGATDIPVAIRLKLENQLLTEIETIAARPGDYAAVPSNTGAIIAIADSIGWDEVLPEEDRSTRDELISWMDKYFRMFPNGVCNVTSDCRRLENGGGNFQCGGPSTCAAGQPGPNDMNLPPRLILADVEMGVGVGFTIYQQHTDMHMFKMRAGSVRGVQIVLSHSDGVSGWE